MGDRKLNVKDQKLIRLIAFGIGAVPRQIFTFITALRSPSDPIYANIRATRHESGLLSSTSNEKLLLDELKAKFRDKNKKVLKNVIGEWQVKLRENTKY